MQFAYKIQKPDGALVEGARDALSREALADALRTEGAPVWIREVQPSRAVAVLSLFVFSFVPLREKVAFAQNMGAMLSAGLPLSRALEVVARQSGSAQFQKIVRAIESDVRKGHALSDALRRFPRVFPAIFPAVVSSGEESGSLASAFASLAEQLERSYTLGRKFIGALMYPALIVLVMVAIGVLMFIYVVPELSSSFAEFGVALPLSTRILIAVSDFLQLHFLLFISCAVLIAAGSAVCFRTRIGGRLFDFAALHMPVVRTMVVELNSARTARTLGSLSAAGVPLVSALGVVMDIVQNSFYRDALRSVRASVEKGKALSAAFADAGSIYEPYFGEMVSSGEETGKLGEMLKDAALFYEAAVEQKTKNFSSVIEPVLMVVVGCAVGFFAYAMILPMYTLMNNV